MELNEVETRKIIEDINKTKNWLFEKVKSKNLDILDGKKRKKRENTQKNII